MEVFKRVLKQGTVRPWRPDRYHVIRCSNKKSLTDQEMVRNKLRTRQLIRSNGTGKKWLSVPHLAFYDFEKIDGVLVFYEGTIYFISADSFQFFQIEVLGVVYFGDRGVMKLGVIFFDNQRVNVNDRLDFTNITKK